MSWNSTIGVGCMTPLFPCLCRCLSVCLLVRPCEPWRRLASFVLIASISVERSRGRRWEGLEGNNTPPRDVSSNENWCNGCGRRWWPRDASEAGNIVVGSQLQIVGVVSARSMTDRRSQLVASYWSVAGAPASISVAPVAGLRVSSAVSRVGGWRRPKRRRRWRWRRDTERPSASRRTSSSSSSGHIDADGRNSRTPAGRMLSTVLQSLWGRDETNCPLTASRGVVLSRPVHTAATVLDWTGFEYV